jgi:hypothetical protein
VRPAAEPRMTLPRPADKADHELHASGLGSCLTQLAAAGKREESRSPQWSRDGCAGGSRRRRNRDTKT